MSGDPEVTLTLGPHRRLDRENPVATFCLTNWTRRPIPFMEGPPQFGFRFHLFDATGRELPLATSFPPPDPGPPAGKTLPPDLTDLYLTVRLDEAYGPQWTEGVRMTAEWYAGVPVNMASRSATDGDPPHLVRAELELPKLLPPPRSDPTADTLPFPKEPLPLPPERAPNFFSRGFGRAVLLLAEAGSILGGVFLLLFWLSAKRRASHRLHAGASSLDREIQRWH